MNPHFASLVMGLATQAGAAMEGNLPEGFPEGAVQPLDLARNLIDTLGMLEAKTRGQLEEDEARLLTQLLTDLRFRFVQASASNV